MDGNGCLEGALIAPLFRCCRALHELGCRTGSGAAGMGGGALAANLLWTAETKPWPELSNRHFVGDQSRYRFRLQRRGKGVYRHRKAE